MQSGRRVLALAAFLGVGTMMGCALLIGIDRRPVDDDPADAPGSLPDGAADGPVFQEGLCKPSFLPFENPSDASFGDGGADATSFVVALQAFGAFAPSRANLDDRATDSKESSSCLISPVAPPELNTWVDREGGADNVGNAVFATFSGPDTPLRPERIQGQVDRGQLAIAFQVLDYNGQPDDDKVTLQFLPLRGLAPNVLLDGGTNDGGVMTIRRGDRTDDWVRDQEFAPAGFPSYATDSARVEGSILTASFREISYKLAFFGTGFSPPLRVELHDVLLRARIVRTPAGDLRLTDGELAGRWRVQSFLDAMAALITVNGMPFCAAPEFKAIKGACKVADLAENAKDDVCPAAENDGRPRQDCTALSTYQTFDTYPINFPTKSQPFPAMDAGCPSSLRRCND